MKSKMVEDISYWEALRAAWILKHVIGKCCPICETTFTPHRPQQVCCSRTCSGKRIKGTLRNWSLNEVALIEKYYSKTGTKTLRNLLSRSIRQIQKKARHLGIRIDEPTGIESRIAEIRREKYER